METFGNIKNRGKSDNKLVNIIKHIDCWGINEKNYQENEWNGSRQFPRTVDGWKKRTIIIIIQREGYDTFFRNVRERFTLNFLIDQNKNVLHVKLASVWKTKGEASTVIDNGILHLLIFFFRMDDCWLRLMADSQIRFWNKFVQIFNLYIVFLT